MRAKLKTFNVFDYFKNNFEHLHHKILFCTSEKGSLLGNLPNEKINPSIRINDLSLGSIVVHIVNNG